MTRQRLTTQEAAEHLGTTVDAVRKRAARGALDAEKGEDGRVYVWLDTGETESQVEGSALVEAKDQQIASLEDQIAFLRRQLEAEREANSENRRIIAGLTNRIPQLEAPTEPQNRGQEATEGPPEGVTLGETPSAAESGVERPWWRRMFGG